MTRAVRTGFEDGTAIARFVVFRYEFSGQGGEKRNCRSAASLG
jgi:hypothetical protein